MKDSLFDQAVKETRQALMKLAEACVGDPGVPKGYSNVILADMTDSLDKLDRSYGRDVSVTSEAQS